MPKKPRHWFDPKCWDLADAFLSDEPSLKTKENTDELAHLIQQTIEDFIGDAREHWQTKEGDAR